MPTSRGTSRAGTTRPKARSTTKAAPKDITSNELATRFAQAVRIGEPKGKERVSKVAATSDDPKADAMVTVNDVSKALSALLPSTNGASVPKPLRGATPIEDLVISGRAALAKLRDIMPGDVDVERAASSIVSKLITLERYHDSVSLLSDMRPALLSQCTLSGPARSSATDQLSLLHLPLPLSTEHPTNAIKITLMANYLVHAIATLSHLVFSPFSLEKVAATYGEDSEVDGGLEHMLQELFSMSNIFQWQPHLSAVLPPKQVDSFLTRAYSVLVKSSAPHSSTHPRAVFAMRHYALLCLLRTQPGSITPAMFWEQANKFCNSLFQKTASPDGLRFKKDEMILRTFSRLVEWVKRRPDHTEFLTGNGFVNFCELWLDFAKRAGHLDDLNLITKLLQSAGSGGPSQTPTTWMPARPRSPVEPNHTNRTSQEARSCSAGDGVRIASIFVKAASILEDHATTGDDRVTQAITEVEEVMYQCSPFLRFFEGEDCEDDCTKDLTRAGSKLRRALDKLRRAALKVVDRPVPSTRGQEGASSPINTLLLKIVAMYADAANERLMVDFLSPALDTLFVLSRTTLIVNSPSTYDTSYDLLKQTLSLPGISTDIPVPEVKGKPRPDATSIDVVTHANYVRCISGAFHNLSATLYQAGQFGAASRFLEQGCVLGEQALSMYQSSASSSDETDEKRHVWSQLGEQVFRRWELLGVCHLKTGDRKAAYNGFIEAIKAFPYDATSFAKMTESAGLKTLFENAAHQQLANLIDRVTYIATNELYLPASEVPLSHPLASSEGTKLASPCISRSTMGALLEQQIEALQSSKWKPTTREAVKAVLSGALSLYNGQETPVRRARVLVKCLAYAYHEDPDTLRTTGYLGHQISDLLAEVQTLLAYEDLKSDSRLSHCRTQHLAAAHLWSALLSYHSSPSASCSIVVQRVEEACIILKSLLEGPNSAAGLKRSVSPKPSKTVRSAATRGAPQRGIPASKSGTLKGKKTPTLPAAPRKALRNTSRNIEHATPHRPSVEVNKPSIALNDLSQLLNLLDMNAQLLGLMGHVIPKLDILQTMKMICEQWPSAVADAHVKASVELAHEYVKLGRLRKATIIYQHALDTVQTGNVSKDAQVTALLRAAESLAMTNDVISGSSRYCEAMSISQKIIHDTQGMSTAQKLKLRMDRLERTATGASVFATIQHHRDDPTAALSGLLQALRLWNRAADSLERVNPAPKSNAEADAEDPFAAPKTSSPSPDNGRSKIDPCATKRAFQRNTTMDGMEWRVAEGMLSTLFALTHAYVVRGSVREAEYFVQQAQDLAESLKLPAMLSRAYARRGEIHLHLGKLDSAHGFLMDALDLMKDIPGVDAADVRRLCGVYNELAAEHKSAQQLYTEALSMLSELEKAFSTVEGHATSSQKGKTATLQIKQKPEDGEALVPSLLAAVLRQRIWSLRDEQGDEYDMLLERFASLPISADTQDEQQALVARLTLHEAYRRFHADMFLSSLTDSTIALPMGMKSNKPLSLTPAGREVSSILGNAEKLFWNDLALLSKRGSVPHVRTATISLSLIAALHGSLGKDGVEGPRVAASLLNAASTLTLRREFLEVIQTKYLDVRTADDTQWPLITQEGAPLPAKIVEKHTKRAHLNALRFDSDDSDDAGHDEGTSLRTYWEHVRARYEASKFDTTSLAMPQVDALPPHWAVVSLNVNSDRSSLFVSRQRAGREPLVFCLPLKGRRESEDDEQLGFEDALDELREIIQASDEVTRSAVHLDKNCKRARAKWWAERSALDKRMKELLDNIEFCWLGAFKTVLCRPTDMSPEALTGLRTRVEKVFKRGLSTRDRKQRAGIRLDDALLECLAALPSKCRDEELEDVVYFVLDLYQLHGVPVVVSEVDVDQLRIDLRTALDDHAKVAGVQDAPTQDEHLFLVLDKNVQGIPWESLPILRGRSVSRIPDLGFLIDRLELAQIGRSARDSSSQVPLDRAAVDPRNAYFVLNPSGDLKATEGRFAPWLGDMKKVGWSGIVGRAPSEQELLHALEHKQLVVYFGHGGGEQYVRSHKIRHLQKCAATMLWGCSSGALREMGEFDRTGTPYNYMVAGCPTLVANLWDVTDKDIDKFAQSVFDDLRLTPDGVRAWTAEGATGTTSVVAAVAKAREVCKLKYLTGSAPVVYGIPFYL